MHARRDILKKASALPLVTVLANPILAKAAAESTTEETLKLSNGSNVKAAVAHPEKAGGASVILIHEWWGLNDQIKAVAAEYAKMGYMAVAVDLYSGNVATKPEDARAYMQKVRAPDATETLVKWLEWSKAHSNTSDKVGTVGWCFGGGWSLNAAIAGPTDASVIYYGNVTRPVPELAKIKAPIQGHFATKDKWINKEMVSGFEAAMKEAGQPAPEVYWYEADHAFANPSGGRYDKEDAQVSWKRTSDFLSKHLS